MKNKNKMKGINTTKRGMTFLNPLYSLYAAFLGAVCIIAMLRPITIGETVNYGISLMVAVAAMCAAVIPPAVLTPEAKSEGDTEGTQCTGFCPFFAFFTGVCFTVAVHFYVEVFTVLGSISLVSTILLTVYGYKNKDRKPEYYI